MNGLVRLAFFLLTRPRLLLEGFVAANLAFLTADIALAHSYNEFADPWQWVPLVLSAISPPLLVLGWLLAYFGRRAADLWIGRGVGGVSAAIGVIGMVLHLQHTFFEEMTLRNLVYTAPFVAPLSYTGLGLLLWLNRTWVANEDEWGGWVLLLALGGFFGNFGLALADHEQNGFFNPAEWIAVAAGAVAVGTLAAALLRPRARGMVGLVLGVLALQVAVGLAGFGWHLAAVLEGPMPTFLENAIYSAPIFAPLLFPNLALLGAIGLLPFLDARQANSASPSGTG